MILTKQEFEAKPGPMTYDEAWKHIMALEAAVEALARYLAARERLAQTEAQAAEYDAARKVLADAGWLEP